MKSTETEINYTLTSTYIGILLSLLQFENVNYE